MNRPALLALLPILAYVPSLVASAAETPGAQFFLLERGIREQGMAGAAAALSDDAGGVFANPAGLAWGKRSQVFVSGLIQPVDDGNIGVGSLGLAYWARARTVVGGGASFMSLGVPGFDASGSPSTGSEQKELSARIALAYRTREFSIGANAKLLRTTLAAPSGTRRLGAEAVDVGAQYGAQGSSDWRVRGGVLAENLGPDQDGFPLPTTVRFGVSVAQARRPILIAVEHRHSLVARDFDSEHLGVEWDLGRVAVRGGASSKRTGAEKFEWSPAFGFGFSHGRLSLDLAFDSWAAGEPATRASIGYSFGPGRIDEKGVIRSAGLPRVAVVTFDALGVEGTEVQALSAAFRSALVRTGRFKVADRENIDKLLAEIRLQMIGATRPEDAAHVGRMVNVDRMFVGSVARIEGRYSVEINLVRVEAAEVEASRSAQAPSLTDLRLEVERMAASFASAVILDR